MNWKLESNEFYVIATKDEKVDRFLSDGNYRFCSPIGYGYCFVAGLQYAMHFSTVDNAKNMIKKLGNTITEQLIIVKVAINFEKLGK